MHSWCCACNAANPSRLKVGWDKEEMATEAAALEVWNGRGVVRLLEADLADGAVLLERLDPTRTLDSLDLLSAAEVIGRLIRRLAVPAPADFRYSDGWADLGGHLARLQDALGSPVPQAWVDLAAALAVDLIASAGNTLLHTRICIPGTCSAGGETSGWRSTRVSPLVTLSGRRPTCWPGDSRSMRGRATFGTPWGGWRPQASCAKNELSSGR